MEYGVHLSGLEHPKRVGLESHARLGLAGGCGFSQLHTAIDVSPLKEQKRGGGGGGGGGARRAPQRSPGKGVG
jgi:hypothetical protein